MTTINGRYHKTLQKNMITGETLFSLLTPDRSLPLTEYGTLTCCGPIPDYPEETPLTLIGEFKDDVFCFSTCRDGSGSDSDIIRFLSGPLFPGVGPKTAEKIREALPGNIFASAAAPDAEEALHKAGIAGDTAVFVIRTLREFTVLDELTSFVRSFNGTYLDVWRLHKTYGSSALSIIKQHPYTAMSLGMSYQVCERMAKAGNVAYYDKERLDALLSEAFRLGEQGGHTAFSLMELFSYARQAEISAGCGYETPVYFLGGRLLSDAFALYEYKGIWYAQRNERFAQEQTIASMIRYLDTKDTEKQTEESRIRKIEQELSVKYSDEQKMAFRLLESPGIKILTGGPGTGKTTVLNGLIRYYRGTRDGAVRLCSPTAAAAKRMRDATGYPAETVHRALGLLTTGEKARQNRAPLERGLIIVDEVSMLDTEIFSILLDQVLPGSILLLVGDEEQLESVGPGSVLADLLEDGNIPSVRLKTVYRQDGTSSILENGSRIRNGETELICDNDSLFYSEQQDEKFTEQALRLMELLYDKDDPFQTRLLTPVRQEKYPYSVSAMNKELQKRLNLTKNTGLLYGDTRFLIGDPVQMTKNNYKAGYINGDTGVITGIRTDGIPALIIKTEGQEEEIEIEGGNLADVELAYVQTIHKSQGGECETCIIVLPEKPKTMLYRKILYVAATRARKKNLFVIQNHSDAAAIKNTGHIRRTTGLKYQLEKSR